MSWTKRTLLGAALLAAPAFGHEFWVEASSYRPGDGDAVAFTLHVGDGFPGEPYARNAAHRKYFETVHRGRRTPVPADGLRLRKGAHIAVYRSRPTRIELPGPKFQAYLREEGLNGIARLREERGTADEPGRELYSRCAKALVACGGAAVEDARVGLPLEIVREAQGRFRVYRDGAPLPHVLVRAFGRAGEPPLAARTGADGRVAFALAPGVRMLGVVHMEPARKGSGADWESLWSSLVLLVEE